MKILVFSDSHGEIGRMAQIIGASDVCGVIFLGDYVRDIDKVASLHPHLNYYVVAGNCDFLSPVPDEGIVELGGAKIFLTHGHRHGVKSDLSRLAAYAKNAGADAAFYGHSHVAYYGEIDGIVLLNPGSITEPRGDIGASYALLEIVDGEFDVRIVEI